MGDRTAFFYGTLMAPEVLYRVCDAEIYGHPRTTKVERFIVKPALLRDYCRHRVYACDYPGMIAEKGKTVRGTYVTGLTDRDVQLLDQFEGSQYTRTTVEIELLVEDEKKAGGTVTKHMAETYVFKDEADLEKREWDFEEFRRDKLHRWAETSDEYREVDEFVENGGGGHDPTGGRGVKAATQAGEAKVASGGVEDEVLKSAV